MTHSHSAVTLVALLVLVLALAGCADADRSAPAATARPSESAASQAPATEAPASEAPASEAPSTAAPVAAEAEVRIEESSFIPELLTVAVGTEVTFVNADPYDHTVTEGTDGDAVSNPIIDEPIAAGGTLSVTFAEPGTVDITCEIHPTMQVTVVVEG
jgi:plastocyanin